MVGHGGAQDWQVRLGHQVEYGTVADGGVLGPLLFAWTEDAFAAGAAVRPAPGASPLLPAQGWGSGTLPMADVTGRLGKP